MRFHHVRAVILDWAGTTVDHGSIAPVIALQRVFKASRVEISPAEARHDMGLLKKDHIRAVLAGERVNLAWSAEHGRFPQEEDVERIFGEFIPQQISVLAEFSRPIAGVVDTVEAWKAAGLRIGSTTGYTRQLLDVVQATAAREGYRPEASVTPDEVGAGRPAPFMCYRNAVLLGVYPLWTCVKIGDTVSDIAEGQNAGMWTIGITRTGNEIGLPFQELEALPLAELQAREAEAKQKLKEAGAHYVAGSVSDCDPALEEIERRLATGERP